MTREEIKTLLPQIKHWIYNTDERIFNLEGYPYFNREDTESIVHVLEAYADGGTIEITYVHEGSLIAGKWFEVNDFEPNKLFVKYRVSN